MTKLYDQQLKKWNGALLALGHDNALAYGRTIELCTVNSIYFRERKWIPERIADWADWRIAAYCLPLFPDSADFVSRMERIADELNDIKDERYESERFLSGLVLFRVPSPEIYEQVLGSTLFSAIAAEVKIHCRDFVDPDPSEHYDLSLQTYVTTNAEIVTTMNERLMLNLISN